MAGIFDGLLAGGINSPLLNIGAGLLATAGPSETPRGIGEGLLLGLTQAQKAQSGQTQNTLLNEQIKTLQSERERQEAFRKTLLEMLGMGEPIQPFHINSFDLGSNLSLAPDLFFPGVNNG